MAKLIKNFRFSDGLIVFLIVINILPVLAPILQYHGFIFPAKLIYFVYSFFCHQIHWRSLHVYDHQCAWCARDMAIWGAFLLVAVWVKFYQLKGLRWYYIVPFAMPIALDGGLQTIATAFGLSNGEAFYVSTNLKRLLTGSIFGIGLGLTVLPIITSLEYKSLQQRFRLPLLKHSLHQLAIIPLALSIMFICYLAFIQIWDLTSNNYEPSNALDSAVKLPPEQSEWFIRRQTAVCPVDIALQTGNSPTDSLALDCFF